MSRRKTRGRSLFLVAILCLSVLGCELEETITLRADGSGTYIVKLLIDKTFGTGPVGDIKADARSRGFTVIEESETPTRHVLVISKEFADIEKLGDYSVRIDQPSKWQRSYSLDMSAKPATLEGAQKRTLRVVFPVPVDSSTNGVVTGNEVVWDATNGGNLHVEASGLLLPYGLTRVQVALGLLAVFMVLALFIRARRGDPVCDSCGTTSNAGSRFCAGCGSKLEQTSLVPVRIVIVWVGVVGACILMAMYGDQVTERFGTILDNVSGEKARRPVEASAIPASGGDDLGNADAGILHGAVSDERASADLSTAASTSSPESMTANEFVGVWRGSNELGNTIIEIKQMDGYIRVREAYDSWGLEYPASLKHDRLVADWKREDFYKNQL